MKKTVPFPRCQAMLRSLAATVCLTGLLASFRVWSADCITPPAGVVGWWRGENDGLDTAGTNHGTLIHGAGFGPGKVGQGFAFASTDQYLQIPNAPALNPTNGLTLEAWVFVANYPGIDGMGVAGKDVPWGQRQYLLGLNPVGNRWSFRPYVGVPGGVAYFNGTLPVQTNTWYHAAMTYDGAQLRLYVNGVLDGSLPVTGPIVTTPGPLFIGYYGPYTLLGGVDELSLYSRALSATEIEAIYNAGSAGKCGAPQIRIHPRSQVGYWGKSVTFDVAAFGEPPLTYQWSKGGVAIADATNTTLVLTNLQMADAGTYTVVVTNSRGSITSNPAILTINPAGVSISLHAAVTIQGVVGLTYGIQCSTDLSNPNSWRGVANIPLSTPTQLWFDVQPADQPQRYYRVLPGPIPIP